MLAAAGSVVLSSAVGGALAHGAEEDVRLPVSGTAESTSTYHSPGMVPADGDPQPVTASVTDLPGSAALTLINAERAKEGLPPLVNSYAMFRVAADWARYMNGIGQWPHMYQVQGVDQHSFARKNGFGTGADLIAVNVSDELSAARGWLGSEEHRRWLMDKNGPMKHVGVARSGIYWTMYLAGHPLSDPAPNTLAWPATPVVGGPTLAPPVASRIGPSSSPQSTLGAEDLEFSTASDGQITAVGSYSGQPLGVLKQAYTWTIDGSVVSTGATFRPSSVHVGKTATVTYTVSDSKVTSALRRTHTIGSDLRVTMVYVTGQPKVGSKLTASCATGGTPIGGKTESISWLIDGAPVADAKTFTPGASHAGRTVSITCIVSDALVTRSSTTEVRIAGTLIPYVPTTRISGKSRYETNYELNRRTMQLDRPVFVTTGTSFPDALSIGPVVALESGALVLTSKSRMDSRLVELIRSKSPSKIYVIGGLSAVSSTVESQLHTAVPSVPVERIAGKTRYETSAEILARFFSDRSFSRAFVATGRNFPDALSAAAAGGAIGAPVLLVNGTGDRGLEPRVLEFLNARGIIDLAIVGSNGAVSARVELNLESIGFSVKRLGGANRYLTNEAINDYAANIDGSAPTSLWVTTGTNFPDALSAAAPAGRPTERLILSSKKCMPQPVVAQLINWPRSSVTTVNIVGGVSALGPDVYNQVACR